MALVDFAVLTGRPVLGWVLLVRKRYGCGNRQDDGCNLSCLDPLVQNRYRQRNSKNWIQGCKKGDHGSLTAVAAGGKESQRTEAVQHTTQDAQKPRRCGNLPIERFLPQNDGCHWGIARGIGGKC